METITFGFFAGLVSAEVDCGEDTSCIQKQIDELNILLNTNKGEASKIQAKLKSIQSQISVAVTKLKITEANIKDRSEKVSTQYLILSVKIREMYMRLRSQPLWISLFSTMNMGEVRRELAYRQDSNEADKQMIVSLVSEIGKLEADKKALEKQKLQLAKLQADLDAQNAVFQKEIKEISTKIAVLSARQQAILAEKQGTFTTTVGDVPLADDVNARPDYNPGFSPAFAAFSFGAPHFKGLSQYGAFGRAKSGQNAETILHAYYGGVEIKKDYDTGKQISVSGYGRMDIETYVKRIYEVPNSWGDEGGFEALKAQAVAARSYALAWTDQGNGGAICTTQACQVYKNADKGGNWERAVNETKGWVLWSNGKPLKSWYASTSGGYQESYTDSYSGYTTPSLWDTPSGRGGWTSQAYEKVGGSPWFYKGWYKGTSGDTCGRSHPWLTGEEMADILNAWVVLKSGSDDRVSPVGSCWGGNPYSLSELKSKAGGSGYSSVTGVSVSYSDGGYTSNVHFETDRGGVDISGADFKKIFNLRAPGRISLKSGLFNIEKK
ncbi:MAG: SpoIID-domain sporulation protein [Candidatus Collierbacteria bacterium GW2011_GWA1_42_60]|nr:MAG: SpoIID-domain sporulation protein [Candidatus Collierbacteria bacterium GW2011_GWA1_42_60]